MRVSLLLFLVFAAVTNAIPATHFETTAAAVQVREGRGTQLRVCLLVVGVRAREQIDARRGGRRHAPPPDHGHVLSW